MACGATACKQDSFRHDPTLSVSVNDRGSLLVYHLLSQIQPDPNSYLSPKPQDPQSLLDPVFLYIWK